MQTVALNSRVVIAPANAAHVTNSGSIEIHGKQNGGNIISRNRNAIGINIDINTNCHFVHQPRTYKEDFLPIVSLVKDAIGKCHRFTYEYVS